MLISNQYYFLKNGKVNLGRFSSKYIRKILEPSGSIQMYITSDTPHLLEKGIPGGILFFGLEGNNPLYIDKTIIESECTCKVNVYKKGDKYVMKIKAVKGGDNNG